MPAQGRKRKRKLVKEEKRKSFFRGYARSFAALLLLTVFLLYVNFTSYFWDSKTKLSLAVNQDDGSVVVATFDPQLGEITQVKIPANTQIELSRQLGTWKVSSIWQLGINEGLYGQLLTESITRHFKIPVFVWADTGSSAFLKGNPVELISSLLRPYRTNLGLGDRVKLALFVIRVKSAKRFNINLDETSFLKERELIGGEVGYVKSGSLPQRLALIYSDPEISKKDFKVVIYDETGVYGAADDVGELIEVVGPKVSSVIRKEGSDTDCQILGKDKQVIKILSKLLSCDKLDRSTEGNFDIELTIGSKFVERF